MDNAPLRVLLVDDDEEECVLVRGLLEPGGKSNMHLDWVNSFEAGLETIHRGTHDVYLIDHHLGARNGLELIRQAQSDGCHRPLILLTGQNEDHLDVLALQSGAADYLDKNQLTPLLLERSIRYSVERARLAEHLRSSNEALQTLIDASPLAICVSDNSSKMAIWNAAAEKIFGWTEDEVIGRPMPLAPKVTLAGREAHLTELLDGERLEGVPLRCVRKDGTLIDVSIWTAPLRDADGRVLANIEILADMTARLKAEEALRTSEEYHRALVENCLDIIALVNPSATFQYVSPSVTKILGYSPDQLIGHDSFELLHPDDQMGARELMATALGSAEEVIPFEVRMRHREGGYRIIEGTGRFLREGVGMKGIVLNARDVTDRRHAERLAAITAELSQPLAPSESLTDWLRAAHQRLTQVMEASNFYVALYDNNREVYWFPYASDEHESFQTYTLEEFRNTLTDYVRRNGKPLRVTQSDFDKMIAAGDVDEIGVPSAVWIGVPLTTPNGVIGVVAMQHYLVEDVYSDRELELFAALGERIALVIERQHAEEARLRLATAIEQTADLVVITDADASIEYVNPAFLHVTGFEYSEVIGRNSNVLKSGRHDAAFYEEMWASLRSGVVWSGNLINRRKDGSLYNEVASITPVRDSSGRIVNFVKVARDVTKELMMEAHLQQSQKLEAIGSLAAGIAHEINTPIQFVGDNTHFLSHSFATLLELLSDSLIAIEKAMGEGAIHPSLKEVLKKREELDISYLMKEVPDAISQSLDGLSRVTDILQAMREFSHPGTGQRSPLDVKRAIEGALAVARRELRNVAEVTTEFDPGLPQIVCHPNDVNQVFLNLLINAAHAVADARGGGRAKGLITVRTQRHDGWIEVSVADNGTGIPEAIRERIFEPFFTTKAIGRGTGQGLAISRDSVVNRLGGELWFESVEGEGTTFHVRLPLEPSTQEVVI